MHFFNRLPLVFKILIVIWTIIVAVFLIWLLFQRPSSDDYPICTMDEHRLCHPALKEIWTGASACSYGDDSRQRKQRGFVECYQAFADCAEFRCVFDRCQSWTPKTDCLSSGISNAAITMARASNLSSEALNSLFASAIADYPYALELCQEKILTWPDPPTNKTCTNLQDYQMFMWG